MSPKIGDKNIKINTTTETNISVEATTTSSKRTPFWTASDALLAPERRRFKSSRLEVRHFSRAMGQPLKYIQIEGVKQVLTTPLWVEGDNRRSIENHSNTSSKKTNRYILSCISRLRRDDRKVQGNSWHVCMAYNGLQKPWTWKYMKQVWQDLWNISNNWLGTELFIRVPTFQYLFMQCPESWLLSLSL